MGNTITFDDIKYGITFFSPSVMKNKLSSYKGKEYAKILEEVMDLCYSYDSEITDKNDKEINLEKLRVVLDFLNEKGFDLNTPLEQPGFSWRPVSALGKFIIYEGTYPEVGDILIDYGAKLDPRDIFLVEGVDRLNFVLKNGGNIEQKSEKKGMTLLSAACHEGNMELVKALVESKADVNAKDNSGHTPLYHSMKTMNTELISYIYENGGRTDVNPYHELSKFVTPSV